MAINGDWVRLTLLPGQEIEHRAAVRKVCTWHCHAQRWLRLGNYIIYDQAWVGFDGRRDYSVAQRSACALDRLSELFGGCGIYSPRWEEIEVSDETREG